MIEKSIQLPSISLIDFWGTQNSNYKKIAEAFPKCKIISRGEEIKLKGNKRDVYVLNEFIQLLVEHFNRFGKITSDDIDNYLEADAHIVDQRVSNENEDGVILHGNKGLKIKAKSAHQNELVEAIYNKDIVFAVGPAGTGKTYLTVAMAVAALKIKKVKKIIITRPAVEAGENLGYLPGDLKEKVDPYLRPIYDALEEMVPPEKLSYYKENNIIEIAPLAFMRGRTLQNAFVILDEAQNTTTMQMKMILTRLGPHSKMVVTGDISQVDLDRRQKSGLVDALYTLKNIAGISIVKLETIDVVRHKLVKKIIDAYETTNLV